MRQLKIKTNVVKRIRKELSSYIQEETKQLGRVEAMRAAQKDDADIRKQVEVLEETRAMIPDCEKRLRVAVDELQNLVANVVDDEKESEEYKEAVEVLST